MAYKKLTAAQKAKNLQISRQIRRAYKAHNVKEKGLTFSQFKNRVLAQKGQDYQGKKVRTTQRAIKKELASTFYIPPKERALTNFYQGIARKFPGVYKRIREFCKDDKGRYHDPKDWTKYDDADEMFIVTNPYTADRIGISVIPSPEDILIVEL